jgi:zinc protease
VFEDDVELPRVTLVWPSAAVFTPDDAPLDLLADLLASGQSSRLVKRLVHELRIAQSVVAYQDSRERAGQFTIEVTAFPGTKLANVVRVVDEEVKRLLREGPTEGELGRARTVAEAQLLDQLDSLQGKAGSASTYMSILGDPDGMARDVARYRAVTVANVAEAGRRTLTRGRLVVSVVPEGQLPLAVLSPVLPVLGGVQ